MALDSAVVYRTEVGFAAFIAGYVVVLILYLAYQGQIVSIRLPGGASVEPVVTPVSSSMGVSSRGLVQTRREESEAGSDGLGQGGSSGAA